MTPRARDIRAHLFTAGLYALLGDDIGAKQHLIRAEHLIAQNPWYSGGAGGSLS